MIKSDSEYGGNIMTKLSIEKIINETVFSMEVEGYIVPVEEKETIREVLKGNIAFSEQLQIYIENAKNYGRKINASPQ